MALKRAADMLEDLIANGDGDREKVSPAEIAREARISKTHITRIRNSQKPGKAAEGSTRGVGVPVLERLMRCYGVRCEYFFADRITGDWRAYRVGAAPPPYPELVDFQGEAAWSELGPEAQMTLQRMVFYGLRPTVKAYRSIASGLDQCVRESGPAPNTSDAADG